MDHFVTLLIIFFSTIFPLLPQERAKVRCDAYISQLEEIRKQSEKEWTSIILIQDEKLAREEDQLRKKHQETEQAVTQCK